jgi:plasmid stability protein
VSKVIYIRDVPDDVHDALAAAARAEGLSLSAYVRRELTQIARRSQRRRQNIAIARKAQQQVAGGVDRATILATLREGRGD